MNIFYLHHAAPLAAKMHCDSHVVKMILETAQMLCTAHHVHGNGAAVPYKPTHINHPSTKWVAASEEHYSWLQMLGVHLCYEYVLRYNRRHACEPYIRGVLASAPPALESQKWSWCEPPQAMPDDCKVPGDSVAAYRKYYQKHKSSFARWRMGGIPVFMLGMYNEHASSYLNEVQFSV
jgi:hypothetical protein